MTIALDSEIGTGAPGGPRAPTLRVLAAVERGAGPDLAAHRSVHGGMSPPDGQRGHRARWAQHVASELRSSGLTGRGGAGFPTSRKLDLMAAQRRRPVLVVNAMEGEPASMKDRVLVTRAPHLVLEGAEAAAAVVGAGEVALCVAPERPDMTAALERAIYERNAAGLAHCAMAVLHPPGRYRTGEESALIDWVGGGAGLPAFRPDKSVPLTVRRAPALLHNAETLAHVALVARYGADWFRRAGTSDAPGTTLVTVTGAVGPGVLEIELGTSVRAVLERAGLTGCPGGVILGGYGGAWIPAEDLDVSFAPRPLSVVGAAVGAGVIGVLPQGACAVMETAHIVRYLAGESAGQCGPCVMGLPAIADDLARLATGVVDRQLETRLDHRLEMVDGRGACRLPDGAVRLTRTMLLSFTDDVRRHLAGRPCEGSRRRPVLPVPGWTS